MKLITRYFATVLVALLATAAWAGPISGVKNVVLSHPDGERRVIGQVTFTDVDQDKSSFAFEIDPGFGEYFLAMRPFRCTSGSQQRLCWYPVKNEPAVISKNDLVPLEYALMFMRTKPADLHLNPFNGVYYKMTWSGDKIVGMLHDVDMDPFITPDSVPASRRQRPLRAGDLSQGDPRSHWLPVLTIE